MALRKPLKKDTKPVFHQDPCTCIYCRSFHSSCYGIKMWLIYGNGIFLVINKSNVCHFQAVDDIGDYPSKFQRDKISLFLSIVGSRFYKGIKSYMLQMTRK